MGAREMVIEGAGRVDDSADGWPGLCRVTIEKRAKLGLVADIHRGSVHRHSGAFEFADRCDALANRSFRIRPCSIPLAAAAASG